MFRLLTSLVGLFNPSFRGSSIPADCDTSSKFRPLSVKVFPDPLIVGENMQLTVVFQNDYDIIRSGIQKIKVNFNGAPVPIPDESLCQYNEGLCPIQYGVHAINNTFITPDIPGTVDMKIGWFTDDTHESLLCVHEQFEIKSN
jgi:hypothetical protein